MKISCPHCGQYYEIDEASIGMEATCEKCGKNFLISVSVTPVQPVENVPNPPEPLAVAAQRCPFCGGELFPGAKKCRHCGEWLNAADKPKSPVIYVLLAFFFGTFGVHNFYSGAKTKGWIKLLLLFGAPTASAILFLPEHIYFAFNSPSSSSFGMLELLNLQVILVCCIWLADSVWCIIEMFRCQNEIARGNKNESPRAFRILKWITLSLILLTFLSVISPFILNFTLHRSATAWDTPDDEESPSSDRSTNVVPTPEDNRIAMQTLSRLDELARVRIRRPLTTQEKIEASKLFDYMIRVHTVKFNDPDGQRLLKNKKSEWGLE